MITQQPNLVDPPSLVSAIMRLNTEVTRMKSELDAAQSEISRLRRGLARERREALARLELGPLRRGVAFLCHPDRSGDAQLMSKLNNLFDLLEQLQKADLP